MKDDNLRQAIKNMSNANGKYADALYEALCGEIPDAFKQRLNIALTAMGIRDYNDCYYDPVHEIYMVPSIFEYEDQMVDFYHLPLDMIKSAERTETMSDLVKRLDGQEHIGSIGVSVEDGGFLSDNDLCLDDIENRLACDSRWFETGGTNLDEVTGLSEEIIAQDRKPDDAVEEHKIRLSDRMPSAHGADSIHDAYEYKDAHGLSEDER